VSTIFKTFLAASIDSGAKSITIVAVAHAVCIDNVP
tara:strand:- start:448 stop:555 length:108 start_codon:yes stop_codon:yes gene_type:complete